MKSFDEVKAIDGKLDLLLIAQEISLKELMEKAEMYLSEIKSQDLKELSRFSEITNEVRLAIHEKRLDKLDSRHEQTDKSNFSRHPQHVTLIVEDKQIYVDRGIITTASPVFYAMFNSEMKEGRTSVATLPGKSFDVVQTTISFLVSKITTAEEFSIPEHQLKKVTQFAEEYQILALKDVCQAKILTLVNSSSEKHILEDYLDLALNHNLQKVYETALDLLSQKYDAAGLRKLQTNTKKKPDFSPSKS